MPRKMGGHLGENRGIEGREQSSGMKLLSSYSCCREAFKDLAMVMFAIVLMKFTSLEWLGSSQTIPLRS